MRLADVVQSWRQADPKHIHPTREHVSEEAYWESGKPQAELVASLLLPTGGGSVLDFGCGDGRIAIPMAKLGLVVTAVDAAPEMIERLQHNSQVEDVYVDSAVWDGVGPNPRGLVFYQFDAVNARAVFIHHAHSDVIKMVTHLSALLKPGGFLVADWPIGGHHERRDWIDVTTWDKPHRDKVANDNGLTLIKEGVPTVSPSIWVKQ